MDEGWKCLQVAQRSMLLYLDQEELKAVALTMRIEAAKLNPWRQEAVTKLLATEENQGQISIRVFRAALLRDEHYSNDAYKDGIRRATTSGLAFALFIGLATLLFLAWGGNLQQAVENPLATNGANLFDALLGVAVLGYLGATMSAITSSSRSVDHPRIPDIVYSFRVTALRLLVGPVSAVILYFAIQSELYKVVFNLAPPDGYALLVLAFIAGFTERLVLRLVEAIAGKPSS